MTLVLLVPMLVLPARGRQLLSDRSGASSTALSVLLFVLILTRVVVRRTVIECGRVGSSRAHGDSCTCRGGAGSPPRGVRQGGGERREVRTRDRG